MRIAILMGALLAGAAHAKCALPRPIVLPLEGAIVPPDPQLYLFVPDQVPYRGEVTANEQAVRDLWVSSVDGEALPFVLERLVDGKVDVYRLSIRAAAGTQFLVRPFQTRVSTVASVEKATVLSVERGPEKNFQWTCSHESTRVIVPSVDAPAFRVTWAEELRGVDAAGARSLILPGRDAWFYRDDAEDAPRRLRLGHLNCAFTNLEWSKPIYVRVTALMADGTEVASRQVLRVEPPPGPGELGPRGRLP